MTFRPQLGLALLGVLAATTAAQAQSYPNRAINWSCHLPRAG